MQEKQKQKQEKRTLRPRQLCRLCLVLRGVLLALFHSYFHFLYFFFANKHAELLAKTTLSIKTETTCKVWMTLKCGIKG